MSTTTENIPQQENQPQQPDQNTQTNASNASMIFNFINFVMSCSKKTKEVANLTIEKIQDPELKQNIKDGMTKAYETVQDPEFQKTVVDGASNLIDKAVENGQYVKDVKDRFVNQDFKETAKNG